MNEIVKEINIQVHEDKTISPNKVEIGNRLENDVTILTFELDDQIKVAGGHLYLMVNKYGKTYPYPVLDGTVRIGRELTKYRSPCTSNIVITTVPIENASSGDAVWISDTLTLTIKDNNINLKDLNEQELPPQFKVLYDDLLSLKNDSKNKLGEIDENTLPFVKNKSGSLCISRDITKLESRAYISKVSFEIYSDLSNVSAESMLYVQEGDILSVENKDYYIIITSYSKDGIYFRNIATVDPKSGDELFELDGSRDCNVTRDEISFIEDELQKKILSPETAEVGQLLRVKSVDVNGRPTEWETVDLSGTVSYTLPVATPTILGGVKPVAKTDEMTQEIGVDANGGLFTKQAIDGKDGNTPFIGENGNWWIGEKDTGVSAGGGSGVIQLTSKEWEPVLDYTWNGNHTIQATAFDSTTGVFTCENHGIADQDLPRYSIIMNDDIAYDTSILPNKKDEAQFTVIDENTFTINGWDFASADNLDTIDVTKFHWEKATKFKIENLEPGNECKIEIHGKGICKSWWCFYMFDANGKIGDAMLKAADNTTGNLNYAEAFRIGYNLGRMDGVIHFDAYIKRIDDTHIEVYREGYYVDSKASSKAFQKFYGKYKSVGDNVITSLQAFYSGQEYQLFANGTTVKVWKKVG
ncbi:hypothetical protein [Frisingicoccus sp.]|uniref:hypothetical protein n=1 Tax=Frisingicoccus sp. TaxID=1918627 RepID=UPI00386E3BCE